MFCLHSIKYLYFYQGEQNIFTLYFLICFIWNNFITETFVFCRNNIKLGFFTARRWIQSLSSFVLQRIFYYKSTVLLIYSVTNKYTYNKINYI